MTKKQIDLVRKSFKRLEPVAEEAAVLFYARLFELDPSLRPMFRGGIREQGLKLMQMIGIAVRGLDDLDALVPAVRTLGARHTEYGVQEHHYETVAEALLWTFEIALREHFTTETKDAWATVYGLLAQTMKEAAAQHTENAAAA
ncbi:MAG TPA: globin family protein [Pyrinomonadaceae bacterium]|nr:globin family protein [Pyrinomonadaceae bacterium]HMP66272.1 globin family protein [Pyrinomonadaceae bacterium]